MQIEDAYIAWQQSIYMFSEIGLDFRRESHEHRNIHNIVIISLFQYLIWAFIRILTLPLVIIWPPCNIIQSKPGLLRVTYIEPTVELPQIHITI